jgi:tRNA threonylcarbamoyladenosine dehydratase
MEHSKNNEKSRAATRDWRFERASRLFGSAAMQKLAESHIAVFGLGGVGSYAVEGLARSGVGRLTLVDFDRVCITNINRQLQALSGTVGRSKAPLMADRVHDINPHAEVRVLEAFYDKTTSAEMLNPRPDLVIDCIDNITAKMHLLASCISLSLPVITTLGAGAKLDPTRIRVIRLSESHTDPLGRALRKHIRRKHDVGDKELEQVMAVFSDENVIKPHFEDGGIRCGVNCVCPAGGNQHHTCSHRHVIYGSAVFVTSAFGMAAASSAVRFLLGMNPYSLKIECPECGIPVVPGDIVRLREERQRQRKAGK